MQAVAAAHLQPVIGADNLKLQQQLISHAVSLHGTRLTSGATPRHYVAFVQLCSKLYTAKRNELVQQQEFLKVICPISKVAKHIYSQKFEACKNLAIPVHCCPLSKAHF